ncbi:MAG: aminotransferase class I/II-fold pyridoxal phosphate-dependent enzyme [Flavobacteriales bacterium]|nr:aminotransferase class I/II-fold pyridoxal phosphate-dependent enzyme [Flavobacteriales bacterium]
MAKIIHNNYIDTVNDTFGEAKRRGVMHLTHEEEHWSGKLRIAGKEMINFGTCGYLGLETDQRLKDRASDYVQRYGTQFSISRAFVINHEVTKLENLLGQIFDNCKSIVFSSTTLAHIGVLPIIVNYTDAIILDQQAHFSIQNAANLMAIKGVPVEMIRHSNLEMLERTIKKLGDRYDKIWYMVDGVYSMYGDLPPIEELNKLMIRYPKLHLYIDDAHGIGWAGKNGAGYVFERLKEKDRTVLISTLAKGFGSSGGIAVFPNRKNYDKVIIFGGPLAYSHPLSPAVLGASIAAAELMLSDEIYVMQRSLQKKIAYCNELLKDSGLPVMSAPDTPIYFIGVGQPNVGYNLIGRLIEDGFYVNLALFPAVSMKNTGLRFTITEHLTENEIYKFIKRVKYHYPRALEDEGKTLNQVRRAFSLPLEKKKRDLTVARSRRNELVLNEFNTITKIDAQLWNSVSKQSSHYSHACMAILESGFNDNIGHEYNWEFHYLVVSDVNGNFVAITFFNSGIIKEDLFAPEEISRQIEERRIDDPNYLTSKALVMGTLFSEGEHLHYDKNHPQYIEAIRKILERVAFIQESNNINSVVLRDFEFGNLVLEKLFHDFGYSKMILPNANNIVDLQRSPDKPLLETLSKRSRRHVRNEVIKNEHLFEFEVRSELTNEEHDLFYKMYKEVARRNLAVNTFVYPQKVIRNMNNIQCWEFVILKLKKGNEFDGKESIQAIGCCYKFGENYVPHLLGLNYDHNREINSYKQFLYQITKNARIRKFKKVHFGYSADVEKKKIGAEQIGKLAFVSIKDTFNLEIINQMTYISNG